MPADPLRGRWIARQLPHVRVAVFSSLRSTSSRAMDLLASGEIAPPALVVASRQTAGRGQHGNRWWSDGGSLTATFLIKAMNGMPCGQVPLRAGLAVAEALSLYSLKGRIRLKWPNDILLEGKKVGGILCSREGGVDVVGVGINVGVNLRRAPVFLREHAAVIHRPGHPGLRRDEILVSLWRAMETARATRDWLEAWTRLDILSGRAVRVVRGGKSLAGYGRGVDHQGRLVVETSAGRVLLTDSADLQLPETGPALYKRSVQS